VVWRGEVRAPQELREEEVSVDAYCGLSVVYIGETKLTELTGRPIPTRDVPRPLLADLWVFFGEPCWVERQTWSVARDPATLEEPRLSGVPPGTLGEELRRRIVPEAGPQLEAHPVEEEKVAPTPNLGWQQTLQGVELGKGHHLAGTVDGRGATVAGDSQSATIPLCRKCPGRGICRHSPGQEAERDPQNREEPHSFPDDSLLLGFIIRRNPYGFYDGRGGIETDPSVRSKAIWFARYVNESGGLGLQRIAEGDTAVA
jgi:hypothetical protein